MPASLPPANSQALPGGAPQAGLPPELLESLRDIHLPDPVGWWPLAPGWWLLLALTVLTCLLFVLWRVRRKRQRFRKLALEELQGLEQAYQQHFDARRYLEDVSALLRRLALSRFPRQQVAGLTGEAWLDFLDQILRRGQEPEASPSLGFNGEIGRALLCAPYAPRFRHAEFELTQVDQLLRAFIDALPIKPLSAVPDMQTVNQSGEAV